MSPWSWVEVSTAHQHCAESKIDQMQAATSNRVCLNCSRFLSSPQSHAVALGRPSCRSIHNGRPPLHKKQNFPSINHKRAYSPQQSRPNGSFSGSLASTFPDPELAATRRTEAPPGRNTSSDAKLKEQDSSRSGKNERLEGRPGPRINYSSTPSARTSETLRQAAKATGTTSKRPLIRWTGGSPHGDGDQDTLRNKVGGHQALRSSQSGWSDLKEGRQINRGPGLETSRSQDVYRQRKSAMDNYEGSFFQRDGTARQKGHHALSDGQMKDRQSEQSGRQNRSFSPHKAADRPKRNDRHQTDRAPSSHDPAEPLGSGNEDVDFERPSNGDGGLKVKKSSRRVIENYDSAPKRRLKEDKSTRRAEKYAREDEDQADELIKGLQQREERRRARQTKKKEAEVARLEQKARQIELPPFISVANLATMLKVRPEAFGEKLQEFGFENFDNEHVLNYENASLIAMEYGFEPAIDRSESEDLKPRPPPPDVSILPQRPPVVTIMGHVDHGKTTLLDYMRSSSVAASEHGGITQHIGAFSVPMTSGKQITFLDTPGHAAFLQMRQRGANVTDIVILVVAADDSVKPQTIEAIKHARAAKVPIIVAINKVDKDEADVEKVKQDLLVQEIEVEDYGGDIQAIPVSGKTGKGLDSLEEAIVTQAEILDMRAEVDGPVEGWVLEATTKRAGRIATVLVSRGTLRPGDIIVAGTTWTRVRTLKNEAGMEVIEAPPGTPVEVDGWRDQPGAGDVVLQAPNEQKATSVVEWREARREQAQAAVDMEAINESRRMHQDKREAEKRERDAEEAKTADAGDRSSKRGKLKGTQPDRDIKATKEKTELYVVVKADVSGSAEAIEGSLAALPLANHPVTLSVLRSGVGPVSESDIDHISAVPPGHGFIISFNQHIPPHILGAAERVQARIMDENIIYKVIDEVRALIEAKLPPIISRRVVGDAEIAQIFDINTGGRKFHKVAGCRVRNGTVSKGGKVTVYRGTVGDPTSVVHEGSSSFLSVFRHHLQTLTCLQVSSQH